MVQDFHSQVDKYKPKMDHLSSLAATADPSGQDTAGTKLKELVERYDNLKALAGERRGLLADYLPTVQQYESSRGAWQDLLHGWEEKVEQLPPPMATSQAIQAQIEDLKVIYNCVHLITQCACVNHWLCPSICIYVCVVVGGEKYILSTINTLQERYSYE